MAADSICSTASFETARTSFATPGLDTGTGVTSHFADSCGSRTASVPVDERGCFSTAAQGADDGVPETQRSDQNAGRGWWHGVSYLMPGRIRHWLGQEDDNTQTSPIPHTHENAQAEDAVETVAPSIISGDSHYYSLPDITNGHHAAQTVQSADESGAESARRDPVKAEEPLSTTTSLQKSSPVHESTQQTFRFVPKVRRMASPVTSLESMCWVTSIFTKVGLFIKVSWKFMKGLFCETLTNKKEFSLLAAKQRLYEVNPQLLDVLGISESDNEEDGDDNQDANAACMNTVSVLSEGDVQTSTLMHDSNNSTDLTNRIARERSTEQAAINRHKNTQRARDLAQSLLNTFVNTFRSYAEKGFKKGLQPERAMVQEIMESAELSAELNEYLDIVAQKKQAKDNRSLDAIKDDVLTDFLTVVLRGLNMDDERVIETYNLFRLGKNKEEDGIVFKEAGDKSMLEFHSWFVVVKQIYLPCRAEVMEKAVATIVEERGLSFRIQKVEWGF